MKIVQTSYRHIYIELSSYVSMTSFLRGGDEAYLGDLSLTDISPFKEIELTMNSKHLTMSVYSYIHIIHSCISNISTNIPEFEKLMSKLIDAIKYKYIGGVLHLQFHFKDLYLLHFIYVRFCIDKSKLEWVKEVDVVYNDSDYIILKNKRKAKIKYKKSLRAKLTKV